MRELDRRGVFLLFPFLDSARDDGRASPQNGSEQSIYTGACMIISMYVLYVYKLKSDVETLITQLMIRQPKVKNYNNNYSKCFVQIRSDTDMKIVTGSGKSAFYAHAIGFKIFCRLKQAGGCGWPFANLVDGWCTSSGLLRRFFSGGH